jgi:methylated-DNA-protein-cysteine methyltransferase-like protein
MPGAARASLHATIYAIVRRIPAGRVTTYGSIARALNMPRGARQVGWAMSAVSDDDVPAHRVVNAAGAVRGGWSADVRRAMLEDEGVTFDLLGHVQLELHLWEPESVGSELDGQHELRTTSRRRRGRRVV